MTIIYVFDLVCGVVSGQSEGISTEVVRLCHCRECPPAVPQRGPQALECSALSSLTACNEGHKRGRLNAYTYST